MVGYRVDSAQRLETDDHQELGIVRRASCNERDSPTTGIDGVDGSVSSEEFNDVFLQ